MSDFGITTALQYSGGRDSRAILHMYRDQLDKIIVVWFDAGDSYPEVVRDMHRLAAQIPHFLILRGQVSREIEQHGYPSDVVPINATIFGRQFVKTAGPLIQSTYDCCSRSIWQPLYQAMKLLGIKKIIRGQRNDEEHTNPHCRDGIVIDGIEYVLPLETWSEAQVETYLRENHIKIPEHYASELESHDCMHCTGYLARNVNRIRNLPPGPYAEVQKRLREIAVVIDRESAPLHTAIGMP